MNHINGKELCKADVYGFTVAKQGILTKHAGMELYYTQQKYGG